MMELRETREKGAWRVEVLDGDTSVSRCWVSDVVMRIGSCPVRTGGIGAVGTLREHQNRGLSRQVMEASVRLMQRERYGISFLHGIPDFYDKFGFITCMAEHGIAIDTRNAERVEGGAKIRGMKKGDLPQIARIYNRDNANRTGSVVRDPRRWDGFGVGTWWGVPTGVRVVVDGRDRVKGYTVFDAVEDRCRAGEVGGVGEEVFAAILRFLAQRAVKLRREQVSLYIPADHAFAIYCRQFGSRDSTLYPRNGGPMGQIIDLAVCLESVLPELAARWGSGDRRESLGIRTDIGSGTLRWDRGKLVLEEGAGSGSVRLRQDHLMQLLMGYVRVEDLTHAGRIEMPRAKRALLERLFPLQHAQLWWADRF